MKETTIDTIAPSQRKAARVAGLTYLLVLLPAIFADFHGPAQVMLDSDSSVTAREIVAGGRDRLLGTAGDLILFVSAYAGLIAALYVVLAPVNRGLARIALLLGAIEIAILVALSLGNADVLRVVGGPEYYRIDDGRPMTALARFSIGTLGGGYNLALLLFGLGSTVFCYLWLKSSYIPRALAAWGVLSSLLLVTCILAFTVFPGLAKIVTVAYYGVPVLVFEAAMGLWLVFKELRPASARS